MATIKVDCDLPVGLDDLDIAHPDREALVTLYKEMEFRQWLGELMEGKDAGVDDVKGASQRLPMRTKRVASARKVLQGKRPCVKTKSS